MTPSVRITFRDLAPTESIEARIRERVDRLARVCPRMQSCRVVVETPHRHRVHGHPFHVRLELTIPHAPIVIASPDHVAASRDLYAAIDAAFELAARRVAEEHGSLRGARRAGPRDGE